MSVLMASYLFIFQIPFQQLLLQGYLCGEESMGSKYVINRVECDGTLIIATRLVSSIYLGAYLVFLYI